ncbi:hypothetical protein HG530_001820 [Fusarium avenaceum]|nr:hypothetical protein HG530_001820 [Fusarium avenaceum]
MEFKDSPMAQFQDSPTESLMSIPGENFASLFAVTTPSATSTMNPMEMMTPQSCSEDQTSSFTHIKEEDDASSTPSPSPTPEKKTAKKRKSWGQVLPEPKTSLPPRKRAKTDDEKEQRRVERVLRNRRAAQSSRERKRQEVEALEKRNQELEAAYKKLQEDHANLKMQFQQAHSSGLVTHSSPLESFRENPSLSQGLFNPQATHTGVDELVSSNTTVDPTTLSPQLLPVAESFEETLDEEPSKEAKLEQTESTSPDLTQLVPVIANLDGANIGLAPAASDDAAFSLGGAYVLPSSIDTDRCVLESGYLSSPHSSIVGDDYMAGDTPAFSLNDDFDISVFFNDDANAISTESMATSDFAAATSSHEPQTSPILARPLADATLVALRLVTEGCDNQVEVLRRGTDGSRGQDDELTQYLTNMALPSRELLMTLLWAIRLEERRIQHETGEVLEVETRSQLHTHQPTVKTVLPVLSEEEFDWADAREGLLRSEDLS